jgi:hypothetical protein
MFDCNRPAEVATDSDLEHAERSKMMVFVYAIYHSSTGIAHKQSVLTAAAAAASAAGTRTSCRYVACMKV